MRRGDIVLVQQSNSPASKGRPCVVVQRDGTLEDAPKVTVCPLTTELSGASMRRPLVTPTERNRLHSPSEIEFDWIFTYREDRLGGIIGRLESNVLDELDEALRRWLDL